MKRGYTRTRYVLQEIEFPELDPTPATRSNVNVLNVGPAPLSVTYSEIIHPI